MRTLPALLTATLLALPLAPAAIASPAARPAAVHEFQGVNWADPRDNYASDEVVPSGLSKTDSYQATYAKSRTVITEFRGKLGANTVRLPVNPPSVTGPFWASYRAAIDAASDLGFKVILGYWESNTAKDGRIDDLAAYHRMWTVLTSTYRANPRVHFEPMNEPFGYTVQQWRDQAADWLRTFPTIPRDRVLIGGTGYSEDVTTVCADPRLNGTRLALHQYGFWHPDWTTYDRWAQDLRRRIGNCAQRTILDEFGANMTTGLDYNGPINGNHEIAYLRSATDTVRSLGLGAVYWPGLRTGDTYSLTRFAGQGLEVTNRSGADRLAWAFGR